MKKINNKGFMLIETLIVSTFIIATLVFLYVQFRNVNHGYDLSFRYNTVDDLYALNNIKKYLSQDGIWVIEQAVDHAALQYVDLTTCTDLYLSETNYCQSLFSTLQVQKLIITKTDLGALKRTLNENKELSDAMKQFIDTIPSTSEGSAQYRLIAEFPDERFATILIG